MKNEKGVTLIALVITIIVLIILAAVSIAMLTGDNGVITESNNAKTETLNATRAEKINNELSAFKADILSDGYISASTFAITLKNLPVADYKYELSAADKADTFTEKSAYSDIYTDGVANGMVLKITSKENTSIFGQIYLKADSTNSISAGKITLAQKP